MKKEIFKKIEYKGFDVDLWASPNVDDENANFGFNVKFIDSRKILYTEDLYFDAETVENEARKYIDEVDEREIKDMEEANRGPEDPEDF